MALKVYCLTHGKTKEHGDTPDTYDADLTEESVAKIQQLTIPAYDFALCGLMIRHKATAKAAGISQCEFTHFAGHDQVMFDIMWGMQEKADEIWQYFQYLAQKFDGKSVLVICSRFLPVLLKYYQNGGLQKYGPFKEFSQRIENNEIIDGITMPLSGAITEVTIDVT